LTPAIVADSPSAGTLFSPPAVPSAIVSLSAPRRTLAGEVPMNALAALPGAPRLPALNARHG
jgi:hypothetical protein